MNLRELYLEFNLFTPDECKKILSYNDSFEFTNYTIKLGKKFFKNGSSMKSQDLVDNSDTKWIFNKLANYLTKKLEIEWNTNPHAVFRLYEKGDYFLEHTDNVDKPNERKGIQRFFTVTVQLTTSENYIGGDVVIDRKHIANRKIGSAALWGSNIIHEIKNIQEGFRRSLVFFVSSKNIRITTKTLI